MQLWRFTATRLLPGLRLIVGQRCPGPDAVMPEAHVGEHMSYCCVLQQQQGEDEGGQKPVAQSQHVSFLNDLSRDGVSAIQAT
jgi:hypothetical protein